jgi:hypothetical protein
LIINYLIVENPPPDTIIDSHPEWVTTTTEATTTEPTSPTSTEATTTEATTTTESTPNP